MAGVSARKEMSHDEMRERLRIVQMDIMLSSPFLGYLLMSLKYIDATDQFWCETAATDGEHIFYNRHYLAQLSFKRQVFVIAHEVLHVLLHHTLRFRTYVDNGGDEADHEFFNWAMDYLVNWILVQDRLGKMPKGCLYDDDYRPENFTSEGLAALLKKKGVKGLRTLDQHVRATVDQNGRPVLVKTREAAKSLDEKTAKWLADKVIEASGVAGGTMSSSLMDIVGRFTNPRMDWRSLLRVALSALDKADYTWMGLNPANPPGFYLPMLQVGESVDVTVAIDESSSVPTDDIIAFFTEIMGIADQFSNFRIHLLTFTTQVNRSIVVNHEIGIEALKKMGRFQGGTDFACVYDHMKAANVRPDLLVMLTDGRPAGSWGDPNFCDTVFIIKGGPSIKAPFGRTAIFEKISA